MILKHQHFDLLGKTILERVVFNPPFKAVSAMENEACFVYAVNGESVLHGATKSESFKTDESILMKCGNFINHWQVSEQQSPYEAIGIHFYPQVLRKVYNNEMPDFLKSKKAQKPTAFQKMQTAPLIKHYVDSLMVYFENPSLVTDDLIMLKVKELILLLYNTDSNGMRELLADLFNPHDIEFREIIKSNIFKDLSVEDLAYLARMSLSSFKRKFKSVFDETPAKYIKKKRLEKAEELLKFSNLRITDVCYESGFNDLGNFSKSFTKYFGIPPSEYQKKYLR